MSNSNFQKTAKIAIFAAAAATMVIAFGATIGATTQQAEAARSGSTVIYCYPTYDPLYGYSYYKCYSNKGECNQDQNADTNSAGACKNYKDTYPF